MAANHCQGSRIPFLATEEVSSDPAAASSFHLSCCCDFLAVGTNSASTGKVKGHSSGKTSLISESRFSETRTGKALYTNAPMD